MLNSHTHCQSAPAKAQTQAWQRVCLSNRTTKMTAKPADDKEHLSDNTVLANVAAQCSADIFVANPSLILHISICGENRHFRQSRNRLLFNITRLQNKNRPAKIILPMA